MKAKDTQIVVLLIVVLLLQLIAGLLLSSSITNAKLWATALRLVTLLLIIRVCRLYAIKKGYSPGLGLLGILDAAGLLILLCLPSKRQVPTEDVEVLRQKSITKHKEIQIIVFLALAITLQVIAVLLIHSSIANSKQWAMALRLAVLVSVVRSCQLYAMKKGYSSALGILGVFHAIGLLIIFCLPRKKML